MTSGGIDWQREKWQSGLGSKFIHQGEKNAVKYADEVIVLSKGVQGYFKETYGRETHFIPNGVNRPQIREASLITDKFGLKKDSYILFLGRLVPEKGIRYLVEAFKNVNAQAAYERLSQAEDELYKTNEQIHYAGQYLSTKEVQQQFTKAIFKKKFRAEHSKELDAYVESVKYFREENDGKLPSLKSLKKRKEELTKEIAERKKVYTPLKEESRRLEVASDNVYSIFRKTNEMKSDLAWKQKWEAEAREKARQEQARQEQRERQPKRKKRSYDMSL